MTRVFATNQTPPGVFAIKPNINLSILEKRKINTLLITEPEWACSAPRRKIVRHSCRRTCYSKESVEE